MVSLADLEAEDALSADQMTRFDAVFAAADKDKSGRIDASELDAVFRKMNVELNAAALTMVMDFLDIDGKRAIPRKEFAFVFGRALKLRDAFLALTQPHVDLEGFRALMHNSIQSVAFDTKQASTLFSLLDRDANGTIELAEWLQLGLFVRHCKLQFVIADLNGDGSISRSELARHLPPLGLTDVPEAMIDVVFKQSDVSHDNKLQLNEFIVLVAKIKIRKAK